MRGHIVSRTPGSWSIVTTVAGKQKWTTIHGTKRDAERELTRIQRAQDQGMYLEPSRITLREYLAKFLAQAGQSRSLRTVERLEELYRVNIMPMLGDVPLNKLTPIAIQELYAELGQRLSARSVSHAHKALSLALKQAVRWSMLTVNPCAAVTPPKPVRTEMKVLNAAELGTLLEAAKGTSLHVPVMLAATAGLRRGEVLGLHWNDLDLEHGTANITRSLEESSHGGLRMKGTKSGRGRQVVLMQMAVEALRYHKAEQARRRLAAGIWADPEELVVTGPGGGLWRPSNFGAAFAHLIRRSSLPRVTFHALRHSHASLALAAGVHPKIVSERLGHANISITMDTYSHMIPGLQERAVTVMEQTLQAGK